MSQSYESSGFQRFLCQSQNCYVLNKLRIPKIAFLRDNNEFNFITTGPIIL